MLCIYAPVLFAQTQIMRLSSKTKNDLTERQAKNYNLLEARKIYQSLNLVEVTQIPTVTQSNNIVLKLPFLPCSEISYIVTYADSTGTEINDKDIVFDTYTWRGQSLQDPAKYKTCTFGEMTLVNHRGVFAGSFTIDNHGYELYDLSEGLQVIAELNPKSEKLINSICGIKQGDISTIQRIPIPAECDQIKTKILVLYTQAALNSVPDGLTINALANLAVAQVNQTLSNSGINYNITLKAVLPLTGFSESGEIADDTNLLASNTYVQNLRNLHKAELVVLLTGDLYGNIFGYVKAVGGTKEDAYAIVDVIDATNWRYTFTHEIGHLYGARHDDDPDPGTAHGYTFDVGTQSNHHYKRTIMTQTNGYFDYDRIQYFSNPNVNLLGQPTGAPFNNNAAKVSDMINYVADFYPDPGLVLKVDVTRSPTLQCITQGTATATAKCGFGKYTYRWYVANYTAGIWQLVGSTPTIDTFVPASTSGFNSRAYKVVVTDGLGRSVSKTIWPVYSCFSGGKFQFISSKKAPDIVISNKLELYPNPANNNLNIDLDLITEGKVIIELLDISGKKIQTLYDGIATSGTNSFTTELKHYAKGIYFVKLSSPDFNKTEKLIIQ